MIKARMLISNGNQHDAMAGSIHPAG